MKPTKSRVMCPDCGKQKMPFESEKKAKIQRGIDVLNQRFKGHLTCPMCGSHDFSVADGFIRNGIQADLNSVVIGGKSIPALPIICNACGFISQHAIGVLGLLGNEEGSKK